MIDPASPYFQNPFEQHQSLWERKDFEGWREVEELSFIGDYYIGVWEKVKEKAVLQNV
jgi:hypothetical protein